MSSRRRIPLLIFLGLSTLLLSCAADASSVRIDVAGHPLRAEIADTPELRARGLMNRRRLDDDSGMLFVFDAEERPSFWMKDTGLTLSIAFIASDGTIRQIDDLEPYSLDAVVSRRNVRFALEVNRGWFETRGIVPGDRVTIPDDIGRNP